MSTLRSLSILVCYISVAATALSMLTLQKRTKRIYMLVLGVFLLGAIGGAVKQAVDEIKIREEFTYEAPNISEDYESAYHEMAAQKTADNLVEAIDDLLREDEIEASDVRIALKISDEGRIYIKEAVIYISEDYQDRISDIQKIVYRNFSKEPVIYVNGGEAT